MTGGLPSVVIADDAHAIESALSGALQVGPGAAAAEDRFVQTQLKTHEMQAVLARAVEAGAFDGADALRSGPSEKTLLSVLAVLEAAKDQLDRVRLRA